MFQKVYLLKIYILSMNINIYNTQSNSEELTINNFNRNHKK